KRIEGMSGIKAFIILAVAALNFSIMARSKRSDPLVSNAILH
ncbi:hypothetical protein HMPREF0080_01301, partial [Anaeroglobus geminatus F0357]